MYLDINPRVLIGMVLGLVVYYIMVFWSLRMPPSGQGSHTRKRQR